jgi:diadenosine tetraphosphate (Ap4A) HIT family hydrolase
MINKYLFCGIDSGRVITKNDLVYAVYDSKPATELHT